MTRCSLLQMGRIIMLTLLTAGVLVSLPRPGYSLDTVKSKTAVVEHEGRRHRGYKVDILPETPGVETVFCDGRFIIVLDASGGKVASSHYDKCFYPTKIRYFFKQKGKVLIRTYCNACPSGDGPEEEVLKVSWWVSGPEVCHSDHYCS